MEDNSNTTTYAEIIDLIYENKEIFLNKMKEKEAEIDELRKELDLSESRRQTAENMVAQIKDEVKNELQNAYKSGYNAALTNPNPTGGTTISNDDSKKLVLNN